MMARRKNPAELLLMGANRPRRRSRKNASPYDSLPVNEKLAFGRLGLGKKDIRTEDDLRKARQLVRETNRRANSFPNPGELLLMGANPANQFEGEVASFAEGAAEDVAAQRAYTDLFPRRKKRRKNSAADARSLREGFSGLSSDHFTVTDEPHVPAGDYADCGEFISVGVKPTSTGTTEQVQKIDFPDRDLTLVADATGNQLYIVGVGQNLTESDIRIFTSSQDERVCLGECRFISYGMAKFGADVPESARGDEAEWVHKMGEEGGSCPKIYYDRKMRRLILDRAAYRIEGSWIRD